MKHFLGKHFGKVIISPNPSTPMIMDCKGCGFRHISPLPTQEQLNKLYSTEYFNEIKPNFGKEHEIDKQWWRSLFKDIFDTVESYLDKRQRRVLDVGAGYLGFCQYGIKRKWDVVGLDPSLQSYKRSQELNIPFYRGNYDENCLHLGIFDVIHAYEVLEHIGEPITFIKQAHRQLEREGILVITSPNEFNLFQEAGDTNHFITKEHINYFTIESLSRLLEDNGLDILEIKTSFPMELFLMMGIDYIGHDRTGRKVHNYRKKFELNMRKALPELFRDWSQFWTDRGLGRDITIYARKA